jgi:hypothetical protein
VRPINDLTGRVFGRLTVIEREASAHHARPVWKCSCDCGNTAIVIGYGLTRGDTLSCGCLVGLVANTRPSRLYDGLTLAEHATRSGISASTLFKRAKKYGEPFPSHLNATRAEQELQVAERDRENGKRSFSRRMGRAAPWHKQDGIAPAPEPVTDISPGTDEQRAQFADQDASKASEQHRADHVKPKGQVRSRWGFDPGPGIRPSRKDRGLK